MTLTRHTVAVPTRLARAHLDLAMNHQKRSPAGIVTVDMALCPERVAPLRDRIAAARRDRRLTVVEDVLARALEAELQDVFEMTCRHAIATVLGTAA